MPNTKATRKANLALSAIAPRCKHVKLSGQSCAAPAVKGHQFCLFHSADYEGHFPTATVPEDASTIQLEIARILRGIENRDLEYKQASLMLYGLQLASQNLTKLGAELPLVAAGPHADPGELASDLFRRLDPLPEHALHAWSALERLIAESHRPYDPSLHGDRLDRPAAPVLGSSDPLNGPPLKSRAPASSRRE